MRWPSDLPPFWRRLVALCALGTLVELLYVWIWARHAPGLGDFNFYNQTSDLIADGRGYINPFTLLFSGHVNPTALHPPAWPVLLSGVSAVSNEAQGIARTSFTDHRMAGVALTPVGILLMGLLARRVGGERLGLIAAALMIIYPSYVGMNGSTMSETLLGPVIIGVLVAAYWVYDKPSWKSALVLGVALGLAVLTRTETLLLVPLLGIPLAWHAGRRRGLVVGGVIALAFVVVLSPWLIRNLVVFEDGIMLTSNDGGTLLGANCPKTYSGPDLGSWRLDCTLPIPLFHEAVVNDKSRTKAIDFALAHKDRWPEVALVRFLRVWGFYKPFRFGEEGQPEWITRAGRVWWLAMLPVGLVGLIIMRRRKQPVWILVMPLVLVAITAVLVYGLPRFRYSAEFSVLLFAAVALEALGVRVAVWRRQRTASSAKAAAAQATAPTAT